MGYEHLRCYFISTQLARIYLVSQQTETIKWALFSGKLLPKCYVSGLQVELILALFSNSASCYHIHKEVMRAAFTSCGKPCGIASLAEGNMYFVVYVTVNMCNQGICVFTENFSEYAYSLTASENTHIP